MAPYLLPLLLAASALVMCMRSAHAHSWVECLDTDRSVVYDKAHEFIYGGPHSAGKCEGYQRNYHGRGANVNDEQLMVKILKDDYNRPNTPVCKPGAADAAGQGFHKRIAVAPGQRVYYAYMPNGHVAVDKAARGTLYGLYWSGKPDVDLMFTTDLTDDRLIDGTRHDFDDRVCGQTYSNKATKELSGRAGDSFPCVGDFEIPRGTKPGVYSIVWMWKFWDEVHDRKEIVTVGGAYGGAAYSSCFDVHVLGGDDVEGSDAFSPEQRSSSEEEEYDSQDQNASAPAPAWTQPW